ncbi:MAG: nucleotidyltransferase family protein [Prevotella sp.]|uniref:nucleotidyltransferase family protein n=1 Tax=Prevotella sp. TaxID=59823 RepID=UPI002A33E822|nr:nucleotidyltransferase family protein [Prevotella sp.]MDD7317927.1 nucleotidyltransferase family protein [Prevotellaceae bacterium]MDY4020818.1 nucleotidyltransferase family protein [Prevotella sp.]
MKRFIELILVAIGRKDRLDFVPTEEDWESLIETAQKQAMIGVFFSAIERLPKEQRPPRDTIIRQYMFVQRIETNNEKLNETCVKIINRLHDAGFEACILKGQGNALLYPEHLRKRRISGDIDVWMLPRVYKEKGELNSIRAVIDYVHRLTPGTRVVYHHTNLPIMKDVRIEVHYRPAFLYTPYRNRRLQRWFLENAEEQFRNAVNTPYGELIMPTREFNMVFQLCHIYKHLFEEGVGLRQLMDYYYVLKSTPANAGKQHDAVRIIRRSGLSRFARAVMWVLQEVFGLEKEYQYIENDERAGRLLLEEIEATGNFGHMDTRFGDKSKESNLHRILRVVSYDMKFFRYYPEEVLWNPLFKLYHWYWRKRMN